MNLRLLVALSGAIVIAGVAGCGTPDTAASTPSTSPEAAAPPCGNGMVTVAAEAPQAAVTHRGVTLTFGLAPDAGTCNVRTHRPSGHMTFSTAPIASPSTSSAPAWRTCRKASAAYHSGQTG